jgi:homoserine O-acetyltransferase
MRAFAAFITLLGLAIGSAGTAAFSSTPNPTYYAQRDGFATAPNFRFADGEVLASLRLHYVTLGVPHRGSDGKIDNAVLLLHSTGGDTTEFLDPDFSGPLFGAGEPLDLKKYYVIIPDSIGHGLSSKPSDGLRAHFPHYGYRDMVDAQHWLVTNQLGVGHLRLVLGLSMGGMHAWLWGERYPATMDALFPISALPVEIGGRNRLWRHIIVEAIRNDPEWSGGNYTRQPNILARLAPLVVIMVQSPERQFERYPTRAAADAWYEQIIRRANTHGDANDVLYRYDASSDYDPAPALETIRARLHLILFADDQINSPEFSVLSREMPKVKHGQYTIVPAGPDTNGEGDDNTKAILWKAKLAAQLH